jgi:L-threonylcarbamoyladenylate synthase
VPVRIVGSEGAVAEACAALRAGQVVAIPTETVYGLAADALNPAAIARVFEAKGRPATNPLIVHVLDAEMAKGFVRGWDLRADLLSRAFWPGPLTLVLPKAEIVPEVVTAGGPTVAVRAPRHPITRAIIAAFGAPLAAPSANRSTGISPTTADAVRDELGDRISLIVDGGACEVGLESTVVDLSVQPAVILRPGQVSARQIEDVLGEKVLSTEAVTGSVAKSPGQMRRHYAPRTPLRLVDAPLSFDDATSTVFLTRTVELPTHVRGRRLPETPEAYAQALYAALRWSDQQGASMIVVETPPIEEPWAAVRDRLSRAAARDDDRE